MQMHCGESGAYLGAEMGGRAPVPHLSAPGSGSHEVRMPGWASRM